MSVSVRHRPAVEDSAHPLAALRALVAASTDRLCASDRLRRSLAVWLIGGLVGIEGFALALAALHGSGGLVIGIGAAGWWMVVGAVLVGGAVMLEGPDGAPIDRYGVPNGLSALRAWSCFPLLLCAYLTLPRGVGFTLWCAVGGVAAALDFVDGWVARSVGPLTVLGKALDPTVDAVFFSMAAIGNISPQIAILPWWLGMWILARYLVPLAAGIVVFALGRRPELGHTTWGRRNTLLTGVVLLTLMTVRIVGGPVSVIALVLGVPLLVPSALLHFGALIERTRVARVAVTVTGGEA